MLPLSFQDGFQLAETVIPAGAGAVPLVINVRAGMQPGEYTMAVQCQSHMPYSPNPQVASPPDHLMTFPSLPVTITVTAPPKK